MRRAEHGASSCSLYERTCAVRRGVNRLGSAVSTVTALEDRRLAPTACASRTSRRRSPKEAQRALDVIPAAGLHFSRIAKGRSLSEEITVLGGPAPCPLSTPTCSSSGADRPARPLRSLWPRTA